MTAGLHTLSDKEKQTLRLLLAGHDAKSMARHLGLSVHTVNERLRDSRRKLSASSSREAARLLREAEGNAPQLSVDNDLGDVLVPASIATSDASTAGWLKRPQAVWIIGGFAMLSLTVALLAMSAAPPVVEAPRATPVAISPETETAVVQSARAWLEMGDASDWQGSWQATTASFRKANTVELWTDVSRKVRVPLGAMLSRTLISADQVPMSPNGGVIVKFRTRFANKADAVETLALAREDGGWKVVGIYLD